MSRNENLKLRAKLQAIIKRMLCEKGLDDTSYQAVADEAGVSRAIVQYYYPQKMDFAIEFLNDLLLASAKALGIEGYDDGRRLTLVEGYRLGCLYYGFLLTEKCVRRLFYDILKHRGLTEELMSLHYEWALDYIDADRPEYNLRSQDVVVAWGGFYELMYYSIKNDVPFDIPSRVIPVIETFLGGDHDGSKALCNADEYRSDSNLIEEVKASMGVR